MNDGQIWTKWLKQCVQGLGAFDRVENAVANGTPDIMYSVPGGSGFMETKLLHGNDIFYLQRWQIPWHTRHSRIDPLHCWFLIYDPHTTQVIMARSDKVLRMPNKPQGERHNEFSLARGLAHEMGRREKVEWDDVQRLLAFGQ